jgi:hypothetical protein
MKPAERAIVALSVLAGACVITSAAAQPAPGAPPDAGAPPSGTTPPPASSADSAWGGLNAGGLAPPPPMNGGTQPPNGAGGAGGGAPTSADIRADLDKSKDKDSGRGVSWFWVEAQGGFEHVGLQTFNVDEASFNAGFVPTTASGGVLSAGIGAQLIFLTLGVRGRMGFFDAWQIGRIGGEIGLRIPLGFVEPRFELGGGYAALGSFDTVVPDKISIEGGYARASAGVDFYPVKVLALGAEASFDFLALKRPGLSLADVQNLKDPSGNSLSDAQKTLLQAEGSGYGATFAIQGTVGLHF